MKQITLVLLAMFISTNMLIAEDLNLDAGSIYLEATEDSGTTVLDRELEDDYLFGGERINYTGSGDDLYLFAETVDFSGRSSGSITAFANSINIDGVVEKNFHGGANSVNINGRINETAFIGANDIAIGPEAVVDGTLIAGCNTLSVYGELNKGLLAGAAKVIIDGPVNGDVNVKTGKLVITERGSINGNLKYDSKAEISETERGRVTGTVKYENQFMAGDNNWDEFEDGMKLFGIIACILFFVSLIVGGLLILLIPGVKSLFKEKREGKSFGKTLLWGLIPLFAYPVVVLVTLPLFPISIALGLAAFPLIGLTTIFGLTLAGQFFFRLFKWKKENVYLQFLFAFGVFSVLSIIPFIGELVGLALMALGSGLIISRLFKTKF